MCNEWDTQPKNISFIINFINNNYYTLLLTDIDECTDSSLNSCDQICINTMGSFVCECNTGYQLNDDLMTCSGM